MVGAVFVLLTVLHGQGDLSVLGAHAEEGRDPHPEHRTRATDEDCARHAGDVAGAHGARQRGAHRLEGGQVLAVILVLLLEDAADGVAHDEAELAHLKEADADGDVDAGAHQQNQHDRAPGEAVDGAVDGLHLVDEAALRQRAAADDHQGHGDGQNPQKPGLFHVQYPPCYCLNPPAGHKKRPAPMLRIRAKRCFAVPPYFTRTSQCGPREQTCLCSPL